MATVIKVGGTRFEYDIDERRWTSEQDASAAEALTGFMDARGPGGDIPNRGLWAISQLTDRGIAVKIVSVDETPEIIPGVLY